MKKIFLICFGLFAGSTFIETATAKHVEESAQSNAYEKEKTFVKTKGEELVRLILKNESDLAKFQKLLTFVKANLDTNRMAKSALAGVYRLAGNKISKQDKTRLEDKVVKYLCSTYVNLTKDRKQKDNFDIKIRKAYKSGNCVVVSSDVKFGQDKWDVVTRFAAQGKPFQITFNNVSVVDRQGFVQLYKEVNSSLDKFEKRLDSLIIKK